MPLTLSGGIGADDVVVAAQRHQRGAGWCDTRRSTTPGASDREALPAIRRSRVSGRRSSGSRSRPPKPAAVAADAVAYPSFATLPGRGRQARRAASGSGRGSQQHALIHQDDARGAHERDPGRAEDGVARADASVMPAAATISGDGVSPAASAAASGSPPGSAAATASAEAGRALGIRLRQRMIAALDRPGRGRARSRSAGRCRPARGWRISSARFRPSSARWPVKIS